MTSFKDIKTIEEALALNEEEWRATWGESVKTFQFIAWHKAFEMLKSVNKDRVGRAVAHQLSSGAMNIYEILTDEKKGVSLPINFKILTDAPMDLGLGENQVENSVGESGQ